jgi:hypothetical protein
MEEVDLNHKKLDFMHLLFNEANAERIAQFVPIIGAM